VSDDRGNRIMFRMQKEDNIWKVIPQPLPEWVLRNEMDFHEAIEEEIQLSLR
jgi:hypothetical protein